MLDQASVGARSLQGSFTLIIGVFAGLPCALVMPHPFFNFNLVMLALVIMSTVEHCELHGLLAITPCALRAQLSLIVTVLLYWDFFDVLLWSYCIYGSCTAQRRVFLMESKVCVDVCLYLFSVVAFERSSMHFCIHFSSSRRPEEAPLDWSDQDFVGSAEEALILKVLCSLRWPLQDALEIFDCCLIPLDWVRYYLPL